jgi:flagellar hook-associated protein FlgK
MQHVLDSNGNDITTSIQGGQLGGAIQIRDQVIPAILTQLNTLASQFAQLSMLPRQKDSIRTATPARISSAFRLGPPRRA